MQDKKLLSRFKKVIVSPYFFPMFVDLIMTSITDVVFFGGDESHGDWHQSARTSRAPHRHNDLYPLKNTQITFSGKSAPSLQFCLKKEHVTCKDSQEKAMTKILHISAQNVCEGTTFIISIISHILVLVWVQTLGRLGD